MSLQYYFKWRYVFTLYAKALPRLRIAHCELSIVLTFRSPRGTIPYKKKGLRFHAVSFLVARCKGFEPLTFWSVARHSIQLS